jgi:hypothetical protein
MGTLATVKFWNGNFSELMILDVNRGGFSILAASNHFAAALMEPAGFSHDNLPLGLVDVPDDVDVICPFSAFPPEKDGAMASAGMPATYECWTQVFGRLKRLVVHPRLREVGLRIEIEIYELVPKTMRELPGSRRKCEVSSDGEYALDGSVANAADRIVLRLTPAVPVKVYATDFIILMRELR